MAEYYAKFSTAEELLHLKEALENFEFQVSALELVAVWLREADMAKRRH